VIRRRDDRELEKMHQANAIVLRTLGVLKSALVPGITTGGSVFCERSWSRASAWGMVRGKTSRM